MQLLGMAGIRLMVAAGCLASTAMAANIVANPGFETGDFTSWTMNNWDVGGVGGVSGVFPHTGSFFADTGCVGTVCIQPDLGSNGAWLYQDLVTTPGTFYNLSFYFSPGDITGGEIQALTGVELQVLWGPSAPPLTASAAGTCLGTTNCVFDTTDTANGTNYALFTVSGLLATSASTRLEFLGEHDPAQIGLDDISVDAAATGVPEPVTFLLLAGGLGAMAAFRRYRRA